MGGRPPLPWVKVRSGRQEGALPLTVSDSPLMSFPFLVEGPIHLQKRELAPSSSQKPGGWLRHRGHRCARTELFTDSGGKLGDRTQPFLRGQEHSVRWWGPICHHPAPGTMRKQTNQEKQPIAAPLGGESPTQGPRPGALAASLAGGPDPVHTGSLQESDGAGPGCCLSPSVPAGLR